MKIHFVSLLLWPLLFTLVTSKPLDDSSEVTTTEQSSSTSTTEAPTTTSVPKIQLNALLSAVQHTVVHSAQSLVNITKLNSTDGNTVISVPITLSTSTQNINLTSPTNEEKTTEKVENIKLEENNSKLPTTTGSNLQPSSLSTTTTPPPQLSNATIAENSTSSVIRTEEKITLFSPGSVIFPSIPAILAEDYKPITSTENPTETTTERNDDTDEDDCSKPKDDQSSGESNEKCEIKNNLSKKKATQVKKAEILKEKIAEVEAEPVILTQGI